MSESYTRCHYVSEQGLECASWFPRGEGNLCVIHRGMISHAMAANGLNKPEYISARQQYESDFRASYILAETNQEKCVILDAHIAAIEKIIEQERVKSQVARALRSEVINGMSEEEIQLRRNMKVPKSESSKESKPRQGKLKGTPEDMIKQTMSKWPNMTEAGARMLLGLD